MRTDGQSAAGNPAMTRAFEDAKIACATTAGPGTFGNPGEQAVSRACMADRGYILVPESQVEARAAAARANAATMGAPPPRIQ